MKDKQKIQNKDYGFTEIKQSYKKNLAKGLIYAVAIYVVVLGTYFVTSYINRTDATEIKDKDTVLIIDILKDIEKTEDIKKDEVKTEAQDNNDVVKTIRDLASLEPVPVKKIDSDNMTIKTKDELDKVGNNVGREGDSTGQYSDNSRKPPVDDNITKPPIDIIKDDPNKNYNPYEVEVAPECINLSQVRAMMQYPEIAREISKEGKVNVKVLVGQDGNVIKIGKMTGEEIFFDEVRDKADKLQFKPGLLNNNTVKVWVTIPFNFKLK